MELRRMLAMLGVALALSACHSLGQREIADTVQADGDVSATVLFIADPQIHNVQGGNVRQTMLVADIASQVAQRRPEMNLLAPYALTALVRQGVKQQVKNPSPFMVILGDATNAGCTGELRRFTQAIRAAKPDRMLLMAHGNHDSFLMGTINYWQSILSEADVSAFESVDFPVDASWWKRADGPLGSGWKPLCYEHDTLSVPIHKVQWLASYMNSLKEEYGLALIKGESREEVFPGTGAAVPVLSFSGTGKPGSRLEKLRYRLEGEWIKPVASETGLLASYNSFMVQAVDVGETHRLVIIDTSACAEFSPPWWKRFPRYFGQNAGLTGCIGASQIKKITDLIEWEREPHRKLVFAGHFPLKKILARDSKALIALMEKNSGPEWTYLSAHTHDPKSALLTSDGGKEINLGSTTDWPMSAYQVQFGKVVTAPTIGVPDPTIKYNGPWPFIWGSELCRHVDAAVKLSNWNPSEGGAFSSPGTWSSYRHCSRSIDCSMKEMKAAMDKIKLRMEDDSGAEQAYQEQMLRIMAAASENEYRTLSFPRLRRLVP